MSNFFQTKIPIFRPRRSWHDLSHGNHLSSKMGKLVPFYCDRSEFGDKYRLSVIAQGRTMPLFTPVMDQLKTKFAFYNVTLRSMWDGLEDFVASSEQWSLDGEVPPEMPQATVGDLLYELGNYQIRQTGEFSIRWKKTLLDYFDYPYWDTEMTERYANEPLPEFASHPAFSLPVCLFPLIAYGFIINEKYLNENIQTVLDVREMRHLRGNIRNWSEAQLDAFFRWTHELELFDVNWNKDYLTAAQPYTQKGRDVVIPLDITIPDNLKLYGDRQPAGGSPTEPAFIGVNNDGEIFYANAVAANYGAVTWYDSQGNRQPANADISVLGSFQTVNDSTTNGKGLLSGDVFSPPISIPGRSASIEHGAITFNLRDSQGNPLEFSSGITINQLRELSAIQRVLELKAIGGTRYVELALHQYGVRISDKTAQRPMLIGGTSIPIKIGEVVQQSATTGVGEEESVLGRYAGTGYQRGGAAACKFYCEEPSIVIGLMWTKPQTSYMWGVPRYLAEMDVFDLLNPHFAHLGEQEVYNYEAMRDTDDPRGTFGYLMRYDHLRTRLSRVHAEMRDKLTDWHMARNNVSVALNPDFVKSDPTTRIFNVTETDSDHLVHQLWINCEVKRSIPKRANPLLK